MSVLGLLAQSSNVLNVSGSIVDLAQIKKALLLPQNSVEDDNIPDGIQGFVFDVPLSESLSLSAQITDHWIENNSTIQDHIAIEPIKITLVGNIAEMVYTTTKAQLYALQAIEKLTFVGAFVPSMSEKALAFVSAYTSVNRQIEQAVSQYNDLNSLFSNTKKKSKQATAYDRLYQFFSNRALVTVKTPWANFTNMAIDSIDFSQSAETSEISEVTVSLKQINMTTVLLSKVPLKGPPKSQRSEPVNNGVTSGKSIAKSAVDGFKEWAKQILGK